MKSGSDDEVSCKGLLNRNTDVTSGTVSIEATVIVDEDDEEEIMEEVEEEEEELTVLEAAINFRFLFLSFRTADDANGSGEWKREAKCVKQSDAEGTLF